MWTRRWPKATDAREQRQLLQASILASILSVQRGLSRGFEVSCALKGNRFLAFQTAPVGSFPEEEEGGQMGRASLQLLCSRPYPGSLSWSGAWEL